MWNGCYGMDYGGYGFFGGIVSLFWWVVVIALVIYIAMWLKRSSRMTGKRDVLDLLNERYAKGEINRAEYEEKRKDLEEVIRQQNCV